MDEVEYTCGGKCKGNILIVGRAGCGKTTFVQNLGKNKLFGNIKEAQLISKIELYNDREENIRDCFVDQIVNIEYPVNVEEFDDLLEKYTRKKACYTKSDLGENMVLDKVIVMDDVSDLADKSNEFAKFLTVSRKYGLTCVYTFHTIYPIRQNWEMIISQTKIFNFFQALFMPFQLSKFCRPLQVDIKIITLLIEIFRSIDWIMKFLSQNKNNA